MKQKTSSLLTILLFLQAVAFAQVDSLVLVKQSRIGYCNAKIEQVAILNMRMAVKETEINLLNSRLDNKQAEITSLNVDIGTYISQLAIKNVENKEITQQNLNYKVEVKQLKKEKVVLKIGLVGVIGLCIWSWISN
jgi:hypothetical protein